MLTQVRIINRIKRIEIEVVNELFEIKQNPELARGRFGVKRN
jgi:hypothetical protein